MSDITPEIILRHGIRELHDQNGDVVGPWCIHCNCFIGEHLPYCPYAAIASLQAQLETYQERHRDAKSNFARMQMLRQENNDLISAIARLREDGEG